MQAGWKKREKTDKLNLQIRFLGFKPAWLAVQGPLCFTAFFLMLHLSNFLLRLGVRVWGWGVRGGWGWWYGFSQGSEIRLKHFETELLVTLQQLRPLAKTCCATGGVIVHTKEREIEEGAERSEQKKKILHIHLSSPHFVLIVIIIVILSYVNIHNPCW